MGDYRTFPFYKMFEKGIDEAIFMRKMTSWCSAFAFTLFNSAFLSPKIAAEHLQTLYERNISPYLSLDGLNTVAAWASRTQLQSNLMQEDRLSMASGVEVRVPFTDHRLFEFAFGLPGFSKVVDGVDKKPLRDLSRGLLPHSISARHKFHFFDPSPRYQATIEQYMEREWKLLLTIPYLREVVNGTP